MKLIRFFKTKLFWTNILLVVVVLVLAFWGLSGWLSNYTRHGEAFEVPDFKRLAYSEAEEIASEANLKLSILDTADYSSTYPRGSIVDQYPAAGSKVKDGREIKLTVNRVKARLIDIPDLIEKTKRRAIYDLESKGFKMGELSYVPYIGKDVVVKIKVRGTEVDPGNRFEKGTVVDLVLGQGLSNTKIMVPYLRFLSEQEARGKILGASLNIGSVIFDEEVMDSSAAKVYRQSPAPSMRPIIFMGAEVDIWLTEDYTKIPNDSLDFLYPEYADSLAHDSTFQ